MVAVHGNLHFQTGPWRVGEVQLEGRVDRHCHIRTVDTAYSEAERDRAEVREVFGAVEGTELPVDLVEEVLIADGEEGCRVELFDAQSDVRPSGLEGLAAHRATYEGEGVDAASVDFGAYGPADFATGGDGEVAYVFLQFDGEVRESERFRSFLEVDGDEFLCQSEC